MVVGTSTGTGRGEHNEGNLMADEDERLDNVPDVILRLPDPPSPLSLLGRK
jgi:hypothetical protein